MNNTILQGDSLKLMKSLPDESFDMTLTDIPYGEVRQKSSGLRLLDRHKADEVNFDIAELVAHLTRLTKGSVYVFCGTKQISQIIELFTTKGLTTRLGVWEKNNPSPMNGKRLWLSGLEFCVFARKPNSTFNMSCKKALWKHPSGRSKIHPTEKPLSLLKELILASSNEGDVIFDPFAGSGSTLVAARNLNRRYFGIEIDPNYFSIASDRLDYDELEALLS